MTHDVVVIGGGVAGLAASLAMVESGADVAVLERMAPGGEAMNIGTAQPYPGGAARVVGAELASELLSDAMDAGVALEFGEATAVAAQADGPVTVTTTAGELVGDHLVVATGAHRPALTVPGADRFAGRGLSACAGCDGPLLAPGPVLVAGTGRTALWESRILRGLGVPVVLAVPSALLGHRLARALCDDAGVTVEADAVPTELRGDGTLGSVTLDRAGDALTVEVRGMVNATEPVPDTAVVRELVTVTADGRIAVDAELRTGHPRILAAGDVRHGAPRYVAAAIGDGLTAGRTVAAAMAGRLAHR